MSVFTKLGVNIAAPADAAGNPRRPVNQDFQVWMTEAERLFYALIAGQGGDVDLPNLLIRYTITGGTENAIEATANLPVPDAAGEALFSIQIAQDNTGPVTINGKPLLTNSGNEVAAGGLVAGGIYLFLDDGMNYRLVSDQASAAVLAAAEAAQQAAEEARDAAESAAGGVQYPVSYGIEQALSPSQRLQAQANIGLGRDAIHENSPFGKTGFKPVVGDGYGAHCGWGGIMPFASGKWVMVYRQASTHAITNGAQLRARDSYDKGNTWVNDRLLYTEADNDARPDAPRVMGNNRGGFFVNRQASPTDTRKFPLFFKTDDEGETFVSQIVETASTTYTFQGHSGLMDWPASKGGHDTGGFMSFGFVAAGGLGALRTADNGDNWEYVTNVAVASGAVTAISESTGVRLKDPDRWVFWSRSQDGGGWRQMLTTWVTTDPFDWGTPLDAGLDQYGNPPGGMIDYETGKIYYLAFGRGGRGIGQFDHHLLMAEADAEALYAANGSFSALGVGYKILTPIPNWATGYIAPFYNSGSWWGTITFGESGVSGGDHGAVGLIGDFIPTTADAMKLVDSFLRRQMGVRTIDIRADDNETTTRPLILRNRSGTITAQFGAYGAVLAADFTFALGASMRWTGTAFMAGTTAPYENDAWINVSVPGATKAAWTSYAGSAQFRTHLNFTNANGLAGGIFTQGQRTGFKPTPSDSVFITGGSGSPEGAIAASPGSVWIRTDGGAGASLYVKESGVGNTGWVAK